MQFHLLLLCLGMQDTIRDLILDRSTPEWSRKVWWLQPHQSGPGRCGGYNHTRVGREGVVVTTTPEWAGKVWWLQPHQSGPGRWGGYNKLNLKQRLLLSHLLFSRYFAFFHNLYTQRERQREGEGERERIIMLYPRLYL